MSGHFSSGGGVATGTSYRLLAARTFIDSLVEQFWTRVDALLSKHTDTSLGQPKARVFLDGMVHFMSKTRFCWRCLSWSSWLRLSLHRYYLLSHLPGWEHLNGFQLQLLSSIGKAVAVSV